MAVSSVPSQEVERRVPQYSYDPDYAWSILKVNIDVKEVTPLSHDAPKPEGHTRFVCISDTHTRTDNLVVPPGDVLIHAGDFSNIGLPKDIEKFKHFLDGLSHKHKVVIAGNHDLTFDSAHYETLWQRFTHSRKYDTEYLKSLIRNTRDVIYLEDQGTTINGIRIWGSPWQPEFGGWGFNLPRGEACLEKWDLIPDDTDVLVTHGPPLGFGDSLQHGGRSGCVQLLHVVQERVRPKYHVFGHIHEGYGVTTDGTTVYINASTCNYNYRPLNPPVVFDLPNKP